MQWCGTLYPGKHGTLTSPVRWQRMAGALPANGSPVTSMRAACHGCWPPRTGCRSGQQDSLVGRPGPAQPARGGASGAQKGVSMFHARRLIAVSAVAVLGWAIPTSIHAQTLSSAPDYEVVHIVATGQTMVDREPVEVAHRRSGSLPPLAGASVPQHAGSTGTRSQTPERPGSSANAPGDGLRSPPTAHIQSEAVVPPDGSELIDDTNQLMQPVGWDARVSPPPRAISPISRAIR